MELRLTQRIKIEEIYNTERKKIFLKNKFEYFEFYLEHERLVGSKQNPMGWD